MVSFIDLSEVREFLTTNKRMEDVYFHCIHSLQVMRSEIENIVTVEPDSVRSQDSDRSFLIDMN